MTTHAPADGPGSPQDEMDPPTRGYSSWVPHDLPYNAEYEDGLIDLILNANHTGSRGIRVIAEDSDEVAVEGESARFQDINLDALPEFNETELPIPLSDPRRIYASPIPGIKLTHPYGWTEGGPSLDPALDTFADDFLLHRPDITNMEQLSRAVDEEVAANMIKLKQRLREREKARIHNDQITKELKSKTDQHDLEKRLHERKADEARKKKEAKAAKERKRMEKERAG